MPGKNSSVQNVTPGEICSGKRPLDSPISPTTAVERPEVATTLHLDTAPSLQQTRDLEITIVNTVNELQHQKNDSPADVVKLVSVLNQSLTAISHWSLQAQLSQLENRSAWDSRLAVENSIIKKEVEFFRNRCLSEARENVLVPTAASSPIVASSSGKVSKSTKSSASKNQKTQPGTNLPLLRLVENHKSHPRMRRTSDNPSASNFVRVFHLERS
ncbi:LAME_0F14620g1_1 [Lachancea meyersii CBS 8951]|uniref:LAME_0F14620g1_1 n=1 Tax=Lachancea meyersii CBS 8951 TaxID=1266667 RepID=A0A1G4JY26_9SACH|nr:LAME_0F14620g1_1 [Lachancea meyersii CBS 8951]